MPTDAQPAAPAAAPAAPTRAPVLRVDSGAPAAKPAAAAAPAPPAAAPPPPTAPAFDPALAARMAELDAERSKLQRQADDYRARAAAFKKYEEADKLRGAGDFLRASELLGIPYDRLTDQMLGRQTAKTPEQIATEAADRRLAEYRKEQESRSKEEQQKALVAQGEQFRQTVYGSVRAKAAELPILTALGAEEDVVQAMVDYAQEFPDDPAALRDIEGFARETEATKQSALAKAGYLKLGTLSDEQAAKVRAFAEDLLKQPAGATAAPTGAAQPSEQKSTESAAPAGRPASNGLKRGNAPLFATNRQRLGTIPTGLSIVR